MKKRKERPLVFWMGLFFGFMMLVFALLLYGFSAFSMRNLRMQEVDRYRELLDLNVRNVDNILAVIENHIGELSYETESIAAIESGKDDTRRFMAKQQLQRQMMQETGWNSMVQMMFFYSPTDEEKTFLHSQTGLQIAETDWLEEQIRFGLDDKISSGTTGKGSFLLRNDRNGYLCRYYKARNSYFGMCIPAQAMLDSLTEILKDEEYIAFLCSTEGEITGICSNGTVPDIGSRISVTSERGPVRLDGKIWIQLITPSTKRDFYIGVLTSDAAIRRQTKTNGRILMLFALACILFSIVLLKLLHSIFYRPIGDLSGRIAKLSGGDLESGEYRAGIISEYNALNAGFSDMIDEIRTLKIENYEKELRVQRSYLQYLQLQSNPHFYLNVLNIIYSLAQLGRFETIQKVTMALVQYSRYTFRDPAKMVTVQEEMELVRNYIDIQKIRFPDKIHFSEEISPEIEDALIPPFIIQTFVENSIKYGIKLELANEIVVEGNIREVGEDLTVCLEIRDNGPGYDEEILAQMQADGWKPSEDGRHIGINNAMQRLQLVFGNKATLILKNDGGARTVLLIPLTWEEEAGSEEVSETRER